jgi:hypothetical protein
MELEGEINLSYENKIELAGSHFRPRHRWRNLTACWLLKIPTINGTNSRIL